MQQRSLRWQERCLFYLEESYDGISIPIPRQPMKCEPLLKSIRFTFDSNGRPATP